MGIRWNQWTGHYKEYLPTLRRSVSQYIRNNEEFKIGVTTNPDTRWPHHKAEEWREMVVVYETSSFEYAKKVEIDLIEHGWNSYLDYSWNERNGGGGLQAMYEKYYIYILLV